MGFKKGGNVLLMDVDIGELLLELFGEVWIDFYRMKLVFVLDAAGDVFGEGAGAWAKFKDGLAKVAFAQDGLGEPRGAREDAAGDKWGRKEALKEGQVGHRFGV